jgi:hypothetical protein
MKPTTPALAAAACLAVVGGGISLLALLPLLGLAWAVADWAWLVGLPLLWWLNRGKARKPKPEDAYLVGHLPRQEAIDKHRARWRKP